MKEMINPYIGKWNLECTYCRKGGTWEIEAEYRNFAEHVSWDFRTNGTLIVRDWGKTENWAWCDFDAEHNRLLLQSEREQTPSYYLTRVAGELLWLCPCKEDDDDPEKCKVRMLFHPQRDTRLQRALNTFINRTRKRPMTAYPVDAIRSLRITDPDRQVPAFTGDPAFGPFGCRLTDDHVGMAVFLHAYSLFQKNRKHGRTNDDLPYYFVQFVAVVDMWLTLYDHGEVMPEIYPLYPESYERQIAAMTVALAKRGIDYELSFANLIRTMKK